VLLVAARIAAVQAATAGWTFTVADGSIGDHHSHSHAA
jgi:hypothetical protein